MLGITKIERDSPNEDYIEGYNDGIEELAMQLICEFSSHLKVVGLYDRLFQLKEELKRGEKINGSKNYRNGN